MSGISVTCKPMFMEKQSQNQPGKYIFAYTIRIENTGSLAAQLMTRKWEILDEKNDKQQVEGDGVIGEQPRLEPGQSFSYTSGVIIETETGTMEGSYTMRRDDGSQFDVAIPMFALVPEKMIH